MAGLVKLACLVLACMIVAGPITSKAALSCGTVNTNVAACIGYLTVGPFPERAAPVLVSLTVLPVQLPTVCSEKSSSHASRLGLLIYWFLDRFALFLFCP